VATVRRESKSKTRRRLLAATLQILDEDGEGALTTTRVANIAGLAQPTFYVHFANLDDLLRSVVQEVLMVWGADTIEARRRSRETPSREHFRETFRVPMQQAIDNPRWFRLMVRHRLDDETSPMGKWSRQVIAVLRESLVHDLRAVGFASRTARDRRLVEMVADGIMALTNEMILGLLDGRYRDLEETIDVLVAFSMGYQALLPAPTVGTED
jgi:TetR/AcrR family transcriptional regulator, fatty acid biosynthesis regulator